MSAGLQAEPLFTFDDKYENPRGIPRAKFIENVEEHVAKNGGNAENILKRLAEEYSKYKFSEQRLVSSKTTLEKKLPEIQKTLKAVQYLKDNLNYEKDISERDGQPPMEVNYGLSETVFVKANVRPQKTVMIWLGANVMAEYTYDEALELLGKNYKSAKENILRIQEDIAWVQEQMTIMEVNTSRTYNYDVIERRKKGEKAPAK
ncbi:hypothetical protein AGDE_01990 [Angomonas deanei]|uniref:Prefoldin subunit 3 n=1 Tax=Angomonas deanei TaxID=59799 RepID=S9VM25_9TRYP|nr:hypothetical protein AGDE_04774 [Angomonas deanei]EPY41232.1 hypothetical protein AGDE_02693 [Angomonas deanei]EPY41933.1 hypothetical protein AGDE_01990 [Angomonas deanei]CAD2215070.1 Prefoldin subunit, putative [Angomonas deanei]|eukprot:EPY39155.1 hypothetical protein AGDE_04774 [Angomonas deanei]